MLQLWLCADRRENTARMLGEVARNASQKRSGQLLLVPEQFSHMMERRLCSCGGASISRYAEVLSFSRLAARVFSEVGGAAERETDAGGKLLMMSLAVEQVRSRLKIYGNCAAKPEFLLQLLDILEEFRGFCVNAEALRAASAELSGVLAVKMEEFALLMESYDAVCANVGQNPQTKLSRLLGALEESGFGAGKHVYFDGFTDFNGVEREIIGQLLANGAQITVALHCDGLDGAGQQFAAARETAAELLHLARRESVRAELHTLPTPAPEAPLAFLREHLFGGAAKPYPAPQETLVRIDAPDLSAECRIAAGEVLRLVEDGLRWRDITLACADYAAYRPVLESVFRRADIPAYFAGDTDILRQPVVHMLLSALDAATGGMEQDTVLAYIKSGFLPISRQNCDQLENYVLLWSITGARWEKPWAMNPYGYRRALDEKGEALLAELNCDRQVLVTPLLRLRDGLRAAKTTGEMILALNAFMEDIALNEQLNAQAEEARRSGALQRAQEYAQVYSIVCTLMEQMYGVLGGTTRTTEEFCRLFRTAVSRYSVGTIPASLDCVNVGSLMSQRQSDGAVLLLLGANEGVFPAAAGNQSLLTDRERTDLMELGIGVMPTAAGCLQRELAAIASVLNAPEQRLYLGAVRGKEAYFVKRIAALFPELSTISDAEALDCRSERDHFIRIASDKARLAALAAQDGEAARHAEALLLSERDTVGALSPKAVEALYGRTLRLSSSKIDTLASCRFRYFLQYGLRTEERKSATMDPSLYGTFVHDVLEHTTRCVQAEGGFATVPLARVLEIAQERMEEYARTELADLWQSARTEYLFRRTFSEVREVVTELYRELSRSAFVPRWLELHFSDGGTLPAVKIVGEKMTARLEGYVDRADVWRCGDTAYVRVIDYKTGKKSFDYTKLLHGLGLQMLLYLFALERSGAALEGVPLIPAGVLYFPARVERVSVTDKLDEKSRDDAQKKNRRRSGLLLDSYAALQAMEPCEDAPTYLPYRYDKEGRRVGDLASEGQLRALEDHVFSTVAALGDALYGGEITPNPYFCDRMDNACAFCPYGEVCRDGVRERWLAKIHSPKEFWQSLSERGRNDG